MTLCLVDEDDDDDDDDDDGHHGTVVFHLAVLLWAQSVQYLVKFADRVAM